jgi:CRP-like cAMP-binding protein
MAALAPQVEVSHWTRESFWEFVEAVGEPQQRILKMLVKQHRATDEQLRKALKVDSNQQLAGILSGISKQAGAQNVPARAVYTIENESSAGNVTKTYVVAIDFLRIATEMNWPED